MFRPEFEHLADLVSNSQNPQLSPGITSLCGVQPVLVNLCLAVGFWVDLCVPQLDGQLMELDLCLQSQRLGVQFSTGHARRGSLGVLGPAAESQGSPPKKEESGKPLLSILCLENPRKGQKWLGVTWLWRLLTGLWCITHPTFCSAQSGRCTRAGQGRKEHNMIHIMEVCSALLPAFFQTGEAGYEPRVLHSLRCRLHAHVFRPAHGLVIPCLVPSKECSRHLTMFPYQELWEE